MSAQVSPPKPVAIDMDSERRLFAPRKPIDRTTRMYEGKLKGRKLVYDAASPPRVTAEEVSVDDLFGMDAPEDDKVIIGMGRMDDGTTRIFLFDNGTYELETGSQ